ncbi:MAG: rhomboid family intramembrane serine protease [Chromatiaceae bacterium]
MPVPDRPQAEADQDVRRLRRAFALAALFIAVLWAIKAFELALGLDLSSFGVYPRRLSSMGGILLAPLIHGSLTHLFANTAPALVLGTALLFGYPRAAWWVLAVVYLGSGLCVWLFARPAYHIGASGLIFGLMFFVFTMGVLRWDRRAIAISLVVFLLYGGMIWGILPIDPRISFEYHFFGAVLGIILAVLLRRLDPPPPEKRYSWEDEESMAADWPFEDMPRNDGVPSDRSTASQRSVPEGPHSSARQRRSCVWDAGAGGGASPLLAAELQRQ